VHLKREEMGLKSSLFGIRGLKNALRRKKIGLESALSSMRGLKNALERQEIRLESVLSNRKRDKARKHIIRRTRARKSTKKK
jgi:hypothetical protein